MPGSISRRDAKTCRASSGEGLATKAPRLRSMRTRPSKASICSAARTTVRLTSNSAADLAFRKLGAGRQPAVDDGVAQLIADRLRAILVRAVDGGKAVIVNVHGQYHPCSF